MYWSGTSITENPLQLDMYKPSKSPAKQHQIPNKEKVVYIRLFSLYLVFLEIAEIYQ